MIDSVDKKFLIDLQSTSAGPSTAHSRLPTSVLPPVEATPSFTIDAANKSFKHQYANIYFIRLKLLREHVEREAERKWREVSGEY